MDEEMDVLEANQTWDLVPLPPGKRAISCKWIYIAKVNHDDSVARLKVRLVVKGYVQVYGVDYTETFSPVAKMASVRLLISLAASSQWLLHYIDVKNTFLHGDLQEEVYMKQPPEIIAERESGYVCRLKKSLNGLKQSLGAWFGRFSFVISDFGLRRSAKDHSVFFRHSSAGCILLVDGIVIIGSDTAEITSLKTFLQNQFQTKDLGSLRYFLEIEVAHCKWRIFLSQRKYTLDLLQNTDMIGAKPSDTPILSRTKLALEDGEVCADLDTYWG
ncbi:Belongs to the helicase [Dionaea muscipula]